MATHVDERDQAHALLNQLSPSQVTTVRVLLETMIDSLDRKLALAPIDDEPETEEERQAVAEALESLQRNGGVSMEVVLADFGLTMDDFIRMADRDSPDTGTPDGEENHLVR
jgi:hypothetical protein